MTDLFKFSLVAIKDALDDYDGIYEPFVKGIAQFVAKGDDLCGDIEFVMRGPNEPDSVTAYIEDDYETLWLEMSYVTSSMLLPIDTDSLRHWGIIVDAEAIQTEDGPRMKVNFGLPGLWEFRNEEDASDE